MRAIAAVVAVVLVAGCGEDPPSATRKAVPAAGAGLQGSYQRVVTAGDIARTEAHRKEAGGQGAPEPGPVRLALSGGTLRFEDPRAAVTVRQDFSATTDGALRLGAYQRPEVGSFCGPDVPATAAYRWRRAGDALVLEATRDGCADRDSLLTGRWNPA